MAANWKCSARKGEDGKVLVGEGIGFERIRRITGYLVGTLDRFNNAKRSEERDRVKHCGAHPVEGKLALTFACKSEAPAKEGSQRVKHGLSCGCHDREAW